MADEAKVKSVEALDAFRSSLIVFIADARRGLNMVLDEVKRTQSWLENTQLPHWQMQLKKRSRGLDQAQAEMMTARMSEFTDAPVRQQMALRWAKAAVQEAEEKIRATKLWIRDFDQVAGPKVIALNPLRHALEQEMPAGVHYLEQTLKILSDYAELGPGHAIAQQPPDQKTSTEAVP